MDLNEIKNRAKDLLADLTEPRPDREDRSRGAVDDQAARADRLEDPAAQTDRLEDPATRTDRLDGPAARPPTERGEEPPASPAAEAPVREVPEQRSAADPAERHLEPVPPLAPAEPEFSAAGQPDDAGRHHLRDRTTPVGAEDAATGNAATGNAATGNAGTGNAATAHRAGAVEPDSDELPANPDRMVTAERAESYGARWDEVKGEFVDEPRRAVAKADALVGELLDELAQLFAQQRREIEQDLDSDRVSTEELRVALRRYRSFFDRLLSV